MLCSKGEAHRTKRKEMQTEIKYNLTHNREPKRTIICRHQKERIHIAREITPLDNKKCEDTLA